MTRFARTLVVGGVLLAVGGCLTAPAVQEETEGCAGVTYPAWSSSLYVLPVPVGQTVYIDLSNCSGSYHSAGLADALAIDFRMAIGTIVTAARAGQVVHVEESGADFNFPNNLVVVDHGDGTFAQYMHLTQDGATVQLGDQVVQGTQIGRSGATGLAGYPHLHFVVTTERFLFPYQSIPVTFRNTAANERSLLSGYQYTANAY